MLSLIRDNDDTCGLDSQILDLTLNAFKFYLILSGYIFLFFEDLLNNCSVTDYGVCCADSLSNNYSSAI